MFCLKYMHEHKGLCIHFRQITHVGPCAHVYISGKSLVPMLQLLNTNIRDLGIIDKGVGRRVRMVWTNPLSEADFFTKLKITPNLTALELSGSYLPTGAPLYYS